MGSSIHNHDRIEADILKIISRTLLEEIYDEELKKASFTGLNLSHDKSLVKVYVDTYDRKQINHLVDKLNEAKGVFRSAIAHKLSIRRVPQIIFVNDESIDNSLKIDSLLDKINNSNN